MDELIDSFVGTEYTLHMMIKKRQIGSETKNSYISALNKTKIADLCVQKNVVKQKFWNQ